MNRNYAYIEILESIMPILVFIEYVRTLYKLGFNFEMEDENV